MPSSNRAPVARGKSAKRVTRRPVRQASFFERHRQALTLGGIAVIVLALGGLAYLSATKPAYACTTIWDPTGGSLGTAAASAGAATPAASAAAATPAASAAGSPGASAAPTPSASQLGYIQPDMGRTHVTPGSAVRYTYCPPASGNHYIGTGIGPIRAGLYGPGDRAIPEGWVHNLEHGGLVLLYKCGGANDPCSDANQSALQKIIRDFPSSPVCNVPPGQIGPVIAKFDDMAWPYAAIVWDVVLPMQTLDENQVLTFFQQRAERFNPEPQCQPSPAPTVPPSATPSGAASAAPTTAPTDIASPAASPAGS